MSGHSKWSKVKHQKATTDVVKAQAFTRASRAITIAVREGGGVTDPNHNFRLRLAVEKAHEVNMPKGNIERAIEKGASGGAGSIEQLQYEGYGPGGVALLVEAASDNKQRTVSAVKNVFDRFGGSLAVPGAVAYLFSRNGVLTVPKEGQPMEKILSLAIDSGADDVVEQADMYEIYTTVPNLLRIKDALVGKGIPIDNTEIIMRPTTPVALDDDKQRAIDVFVEALDELEDVQKVFTNIA